MGKVATCINLDRELIKRLDNLVPFHGYRSRSDLANDLLTKWVSNPQKKEAKNHE